MSEGLDPILQQKEQQQLKTQLLWRLGIAGGLIAALLFGIAWIEKSQDNAQPNIQIPQIAPELNASEAATVASAASEAATASPEPTNSAPPTPSITPNNTPFATLAAAPNATASAKSVNGSPIQNIDNLPQKVPQASKQPETRLNAIATAIPLKSNTTAAPNKPANNQTISAPQVITQDFPAPISSTRGYSVQAGVFLHSNNAEKLLNQLQQAGIPAYLETRVQIGPFKNKAEADAAVKKLKALGITPIVKTQ